MSITITFSEIEASQIREALTIAIAETEDKEWAKDIVSIHNRLCPHIPHEAAFDEAGAAHMERQIVSEPAPEPIIHVLEDGAIEVEITPEFAHELDTCPFNEPEGLLMQPGTYLVSHTIKREPENGISDEVEITPIFILASGPGKLDPGSDLTDFITPEDCERGYAELPFYVDLPLPAPAPAL